VGGVFVLCTFAMSVCMLTVSKALLMSSETMTVLSAGFLWLNPSVMTLFMLCSAVTVECCALKPCWCSLLSMLFVICGSITFSRVLAMGDSSEIGR
jgi:hypothetical protein